MTDGRESATTCRLRFPGRGSGGVGADDDDDDDDDDGRRMRMRRATERRGTERRRRRRRRRTAATIGATASFCASLLLLTLLVISPAVALSADDDDVGASSQPAVAAKVDEWGDHPRRPGGGGAEGGRTTMIVDDDDEDDVAIEGLSKHHRRYRHRGPGEDAAPPSPPAADATAATGGVDGGETNTVVVIDYDSAVDYASHSCAELPRLPEGFDVCRFADECDGGDGVLLPGLFCDRYEDDDDDDEEEEDEDKATRTDDTEGNPAIGTANDNGRRHRHRSRRRYRNHPYRRFLSLLPLTTLLLLLFRLLTSTTDEFFSPGLEMFSLQLGLPPRFAGVTLLALGNGAPDVAATMNAMLATGKGGGGGGGGGSKGYEMALGELTGTCMFVTTVVFGIIVILVGGGGGGGGGSAIVTDGGAPSSGVPCRGSLLRDIAVLVLVCAVSMSYLQSGTIDVGFVRVMLGIYASYVLLVLFADAHHVFYHAPKRARMELAAKDGGAGAEAGGESSSTPAVAKTTETRADGKGGGGSVANDCTPLLPPASSSPPAVRVAYARKHSHSLSETVIEAMSNYSCSADDDDEEEEEARMAGVDRWAPVQDDGTEPLVIFHPHHAVHPHHPGGPSLLRVSEEGGPARSRGVRMHSSSFDTVDEGPAHSSARPAGAACARLRSSSFEAATLPSKMTNAPSDIESEIDGGTPIVDDRSAHSPPSRCGGGGGRPSSWKEAYHANVKEFSDHWRDFFMDIYFNNDNQDKNDNNGLWDILALTVELPFTIARKVRLFFVCVFSLRVSSPSPSLTPFPNQLTNPVPCDGYYCRPLVAVSLTLSPLWLWFYFLDQFDVDIFSSHVGYVLSTMTLATGLVVIRFAPGGDGPMDFYMVVSSTAPH